MAVDVPALGDEQQLDAGEQPVLDAAAAPLAPDADAAANSPQQPDAPPASAPGSPEAPLAVDDDLCLSPELPAMEVELDEAVPPARTVDDAHEDEGEAVADEAEDQAEDPLLLVAQLLGLLDDEDDELVLEQEEEEVGKDPEGMSYTHRLILFECSCISTPHQ